MGRGLTPSPLGEILHARVYQNLGGFSRRRRRSLERMIGVCFLRHATLHIWVTVKVDSFQPHDALLAFDKFFDNSGEAG